MSEYQQSIQAFIDMINAKDIPAEDLPDLLKVAEEMPEDDEAIARGIDNWLKPEFRSKIKESYEKQLSNLSMEPGKESESTKALLINGIRMGFGGAKMEPGKESESSEVLVINTIKKNTPEPKSEENSKDK